MNMARPRKTPAPEGNQNHPEPQGNQDQELAKTPEPVNDDDQVKQDTRDAEIESMRAEIEALRKAKTPEPVVAQPQQIVGLSLAESRAQAQKQKLDARKIQQQSGNIQRLNGNKEESYEFPEWEKDLFHVRITMRPPENIRGKNFVTEGGKTFEKTELPVKIWKGNRIQFERMEKSNAFKSYQGVHILHDPRIN